MSTLAQLRTRVKTLYRITATDLDNFIDAQLNENYSSACRKPPYWRQLVYQGASFSTTSGTELYATSSDFNRIVPNSVLYYPNGSTQGYPLNDVDILVAEPFNRISSAQYPGLAYVTASTSGNGKRIALSPAFTDPSGTVTYDYYKFASSLSSSSTPEVYELEDYMVYATLADVAVYREDEKRATEYRAKAREFMGNAWQTITAN